MARLSYDDRKDQIIQAARHVFSETGFSGTSIKDIAKEAGMSPALLYTYFENKAALYNAVLQSTSDYANPMIKEMEAMGPGSRALVLCIYDLLHSNLFGTPGRSYEEQKDFDKFFFRSMIGNRDFARQNHIAFENFFAGEFIDACFHAAQAAGEMLALPATPKIRMQFVIHIAGYFKLTFLPGVAVYEYNMSKHQLLENALLFCMRGVGFTPEAIEKYYHPQKLRAAMNRVRGQPAE